MEYAGRNEEENGKKTKDGRKKKKEWSLKGRLTPSTVSVQEENRPPATASAENQAPDLPDQQGEEIGSIQQRRRGTFINHTPRDFEIRTSKRTEAQSSTESYSRPHTSYQGSSDINTRPSSRQHGQNSSFGSSHAETKCYGVSDCPVELDSKAVARAHSENSDSRSWTANDDSTEISKADKKPAQSPTEPTDTYGGAQEDGSTAVEFQGDSKPRRRQTPFKNSSPPSTCSTRHMPLEPLVAQHRRGPAISKVSDLPPQLHVDQVAQLSTDRAFQEYFRGQEGTQTPEQSAIHGEVRPMIRTPEVPIPSSPLAFPAGDLKIPNAPAPDLPHRNPERLIDPSTPHLRTRSGLSLTGDFASAARGQYSPYDRQHDTASPTMPRSRGHTPAAQSSRADSSAQGGKLAPPIPSHEQLTASTGLSDLCFFLKNSGPPPALPALPPRSTPQKKGKSGLKVFKVRNRMSSVVRVSSIGPQQRSKVAPSLPACARQTSTTGGAKHIEIVVPAGDQRGTVPVNGGAVSKRVSIAWTDEMLSPLASPAVEAAISGRRQDPSSPSPPPRGSPRNPRKPPTPPRLVPVDRHPLASREEQTRARKLRDLERVRGKGDAGAGAGAPRRSTDSIERLGEAMRLVRDETVQLRGLNAELTAALARVLGVEDTGPERVLEAFRERCG